MNGNTYQIEGWRTFQTKVLIYVRFKETLLMRRWFFFCRTVVFISKIKLKANNHPYACIYYPSFGDKRNSYAPSVSFHSSKLFFYYNGKKKKNSPSKRFAPERVNDSIHMLNSATRLGGENSGVNHRRQYGGR